jgi:hypothetical protein
MKANFTAGFADARLEEGRAPMVAKLHTGDTVVEFETSFLKKHAWPLHRFLSALARGKSPKEAFTYGFGHHSK